MLAAITQARVIADHFLSMFIGKTTATNNTGYDFDYINFDVELFDSSGVKVETASLYANHWLDGETIALDCYTSINSSRPPGLAGCGKRFATCKPSGLELFIGYSESIMMLKISRSVSLMPSRAMRLTLRMVSSTPMVTIPSPA